MATAPSSSYTPISQKDLEDPALYHLNLQLQSLWNKVTALYAANVTLQGELTMARALVTNTTPASNNELVCKGWVSQNFTSST